MGFLRNKKSLMLDAERLDADLSKATDLLERAGASLKNGNYTEAIAAVKEAETEIQNSQFQKVLEAISQSRSKFVAANKVGADLSDAMEYLNNAREALKEGKFQEALDMALKGDAVVDEIVKEFQDIENTIAELEEQITKGKERGIDLSGAQESLDAAKESLEARDGCWPDAWRRTTRSVGWIASTGRVPRGESGSTRSIFARRSSRT